MLGMNVADARRSCAPGGCWDLAVMRHIGQHMLNGIAGMHKLGYIHRDIKPANFAITPRHATPAEGVTCVSWCMAVIAIIIAAVA